MSEIETNKENCKDLTKKLAKQIVSFDYEDMPEELLARGRQVFIDGIAVAVAGSRQEVPPKILAENVKKLGGNEEVTVIGQGFKTSMVQAAMVNGGSMHVLDYEPMWNPPNHLLSTCLPAALSIAEQKKLSGKKLLTAMIKGIEMSCAMRGASNMQDLNENRFHPPGMVGPLGATVAASHLLELDEMQTRYALGIVGSRCGTIWANVGTHTKCLHTGQASSVGLDSALLASQGYTSNPDILEHERGYITSYLNWEKFDANILLGYGKKFRIINPGYEIKMYPSNFGTHPGINAALDIRTKIKDIHDIDKIYVGYANQTYINRPEPISGLDGKFSLQYTLVRALIDGEVVLESFEDEKRFDPLVDELLKKIDLHMFPDRPVVLNGLPLDLEITLKDGTVLSVKGQAPKGGLFGEKPVSFESHYTKLMSCLMKAMSKEDAEKVIEMGYRIDELSEDELTEFFRLIRC